MIFYHCLIPMLSNGQAYNRKQYYCPYSISSIQMKTTTPSAAALIHRLFLGKRRKEGRIRAQQPSVCLCISATHVHTSIYTYSQPTANSQHNPRFGLLASLGVVVIFPPFPFHLNLNLSRSFDLLWFSPSCCVLVGFFRLWKEGRNNII